MLGSGPPGVKTPLGPLTKILDPLLSTVQSLNRSGSFFLHTVHRVFPFPSSWPCNAVLGWIVVVVVDSGNFLNAQNVFKGHRNCVRQNQWKIRKYRPLLHCIFLSLSLSLSVSFSFSFILSPSLWLWWRIQNPKSPDSFKDQNNSLKAEPEKVLFHYIPLTHCLSPYLFLSVCLCLSVCLSLSLSRSPFLSLSHTFTPC